MKGGDIFTGGGWHIPFFGKGRSPLKSKNHNAAVVALNALGKIRIVRNPAAREDRVYYAEGGVVLEIAGQAGGGPGDGTVTVSDIDGTPIIAGVTELEFTNGSVTDQGGGVARIEPFIAVKDIDGTPSVSAKTIEFTSGSVTDQGSGVARIEPFVTVKDIDGTPSVNAKTIEFTNGTVSDQGSGVARVVIASSGLTQMRVKSRSGDVLTCRTWDGSSEGGTDIRVATNQDSRQLSSETINGTTYTYSSYSDIGDGINFSRTSNDGVTSETQIVTPLWYSNAVIMVAVCDFSGASYSGADLKYIEVSSRCWAKDEYL